MNRNKDPSNKQELFFFDNAWLVPKLPPKGQLVTIVYLTIPCILGEWMNVSTHS